jgi:hypothetical protein
MGTIPSSANYEGATMQDNLSADVASELSLNKGPHCQSHQLKIY